MAKKWSDSSHAKRRNPDLYERCNEIIREAGHEDPEAVDPMTRFETVMKHIMARPKPSKIDVSEG